MRQPRKPLWTDGLFLEPHHLQRQDQYHELLLARRLAAVSPQDWGVVELEIDPRALQTGEVHVVRLKAVLPDGTILDVGDDSGNLLPARRFEGFGGFGTTQGSSARAGRPLDVYVGLPRESDQLPNVDLKSDPATTARYLRMQATAVDLNSGTDERGIEWAGNNLRILFGDEPVDRFDVIRIAQLVRATSGSVVFNEAFVPPVLQIGASPFLQEGFRQILRVMIAKQQGLALSRRQRSAATVEFQAADAPKFWLLHTLNGLLPLVSEVVDKASTPPREAYAVLSQLIGQLCTFDVQADPMNIPRFNFLELGSVFEPMFKLALELLNRVISERYVEIPLEIRENGLRVGKLRDSAIYQHAFFLAVSGKYPEAQVRDQVPKLTKIASFQQIGRILNSAVNGSRLALEHHPPSALPVKPGVVFFRLETAGDFWVNMVTTGTVAIQSPFDPAAMQLALYAVDPVFLQ
ncbi:MAG: type VI secretion system baseplate subunit TssK [Polyangiaceae bacterium]|nr:type VI secretion system baseplate subunit TssK [Polyangiaceae bacterium]